MPNLALQDAKYWARVIEEKIDETLTMIQDLDNAMQSTALFEIEVKVNGLKSRIHHLKSDLNQIEAHLLTT